jgi:hypothetical protein
VSALLILWDGTQLVDAAVGYADNDDLVRRLLGFRPTRHAPLSVDQTLYESAADAPEPDEDEEGDAALADYAGLDGHP